MNCSRGSYSNLLQVALCSAYARIVKVCPPYIWQPESLIAALYHLEPFLPLVECFHVALSTLGSHLVGGMRGNHGTFTKSTYEDKSSGNTRLGQKRSVQDVDQLKTKRKKLSEDISVAYANVKVECKYLRVVACPKGEDYADHMNKCLLSFVKFLHAPSKEPGHLRPDMALSALSMLCIIFSTYPETNLSLNILQQMLAWIPWIAEQVDRLQLLIHVI